MWEVKTNDGGLRDWAKTYDNTFSNVFDFGPPPPPLVNPTTVFDYIYAVDATNLCGFSDWHLPTIDELHSIVDYGVGTAGSSIDSARFPNTQGSAYWTSTSYNPAGSMSPFNSWSINFLDGRYSTGNRSERHYVRLVRGNTSQNTPRYTVSANGQEVVDNKTKLIWRRCIEGMVFNGSTCTGTSEKFSQEAALQQAALQANSSGVAWRLPNIKELSSIADKSIYFDPAIDSTAFPAAPTSYLWSSTPNVDNSTTSWHLILGDGRIAWSSRFLGTDVRLVRSGQ
jgi:hypothetical protein